MVKLNHCTIVKPVKGKLPSLPFVSIKNTILGKSYTLEIAFLTAQQQKKINKDYLNLDKTTTVLSFSLSKTSGQITFDLEKVKKDAHLFKMSHEQFLQYLLIHGLLHLKGFKHSSTMEKEEEKFMKKFS